LAGPSLFDLLTSLASPKQISALKLKDIYEMLTSHFSLGPSVIAAFNQFHKRDQQSGETVSSSFGPDCQFGAALDRMLRDRFVCGMKEDGLQRAFLAETELYIKCAVNRATTSEAAPVSALAVRHRNEAVQAINSFPSSNFRSSARRLNTHTCPGNGPKYGGCWAQHSRAQCPYRDVVCHGCGCKEHIVRGCRRSAGQESPVANSSLVPTKKSNHPRTSINQVVPLIE